MSGSRLTILRHGSGVWRSDGEETIGTVDRLRQFLREGSLGGRLLRFDEARVLTHRIESIGRPLKLGLMLRALSRGPCYVEDESGRRRPLSAALLARWAWQAGREPFRKGAMLREVEARVERIARAVAQGRRVGVTRGAAPAYLRTDVRFGLQAGGSIAHIAGVVNHLGEFTGPPIMLTSDPIPTVAPTIEVHCVAPAEAFWGYRELPSLVANEEFDRAAERALEGRRLAFVYQRYSVNNFAGARLAFERSVPFVLEYNGSEVWISRHWGVPLQYEALSERIEQANLAAADLIVVVSRPMADELVARGVARDKILVNPNGVEPDVYAPTVDGTAVRRRYGLEGRFVVGFIGTFGPWHGAEVLADAFGRLLMAHPEYRDTVRLLMIGDGARMADVGRILDTPITRGRAVLTGTVPQCEGPEHLAACDLLVSPHVPNADGTPFFGSPTKLFEYMAMGKPIVASDLDQIGEILEHGHAARMTVPGDASSIADAIAALIESPEERQRLGAEARRFAVERHSWREHTRRIVQRLLETTGG